MRLRWRISLIVALAMTLPVAGFGYWAATTSTERAETEYRRRLDSTARVAQARLAERHAADRRAVERLCSGDFVIDRLLLDLAANRFDPARQDELVTLLPGLMRSLGFDTLEVLDARARADARGTVLAAGHYPGRAGARDAPLVAATREPREDWMVRTVRIHDGRHAEDRRALLVACTAARGSVEVRVVAARFLDPGFVTSLVGDTHPVTLGLRTPAEVGDARIVHRFTEPDGDPAEALVAELDLAPLEEQRAALIRDVAVAAAIAALLGMIVGFAIAAYASRPLRVLEDAARRVGGGDLESTVSVGGSGEVRHALEAFNRMTHELRARRERLARAERIAAWREIAQRMAHEIKNPLSPIQTSIETMRKTYAKKHPDFDEIFEESTVAILDAVDRLKRTVTEFSDFARMPRPKPIELDVRDVVSQVANLHAGGDVELGVRMADDLPRVRADREQIAQVLENLVTNAEQAAISRHGMSGGAVEVVVERWSGGVEVRIGDNGPGVPADERAKIFMPKYTTKSTGTGLGLAIVDRIVADHGGTIEVGESPLGGAEMRLRLTREGPPAGADVSTSEGALPLVHRR